MSEEENQSFFDGMKNFDSHFQEAINSDEPDMSLYNEMAESDKRYGEFDFIDKGGMKSIYACEDYRTARKVAVARLKDSSKAEDFDRFIREARITAALEHPNIMPVYDLDVDEKGEPFFSMKYIKGFNLEEYIKKEAPSVLTLMQVFLKICDAMNYAHSKGIVHLDLKPANIQMGEYGEVLVCDWGIAKILNQDSDETVSLDPNIYNEGTLDGLVKGSPGYMAPEQIDKKHGSKNQLTDVYSLGGILYYMLVKRKPADHSNVKESLRLTNEGQIKAPSGILPVPEGLEAVCMKALSVNQEDRYRSAGELKDEVEKWLQGFATEAENASFLKALLLLVKRHKVTAALILLFLVISSGLLIKAYVADKKVLGALRLTMQQQEKIQRMSLEEAPRLIELAEIAVTKYDFEEAMIFSNLAVQRDPENKDAWKVKGKIHFIRQEFNACLEALKDTVPGYNRKVKDVCRKYGTLKDDGELLDLEKFKDLIGYHAHMQFAYLMCGFAEKHAPSLDDRLGVALFFTTELTNQHVENWDIKIDRGDGFLKIDLTGVPAIHSLSGLRNLPVTELDISETEISEIQDILTMPLIELNIANAKILDPRRLVKMPTLKKIIIGKDQYSDLEFNPIDGLEIVRLP